MPRPKKQTKDEEQGTKIKQPEAPSKEDKNIKGTNRPVLKKPRKKKGRSPVVSVRPIDMGGNGSRAHNIASLFRDEDKVKVKKPRVEKEKQSPQNNVKLTSIPKTNVFAKRQKPVEPQFDQNGKQTWNGKPFSILVGTFEHQELLDRYLKNVKSHFKDWKFTTRRSKEAQQT